MTVNRILQSLPSNYFKDLYARDNCKQKGGKLYEPKDVAEIKRMAIVAFGVRNFGPAMVWIGITDTVNEGTWVYNSTAQSITFNLPWAGQDQKYIYQFCPYPSYGQQE